MNVFVTLPSQVVQAGGGGYGSRLPVRPGTPVLREAQKHVRRRLEKKWLNEFLSSPEFIARNGGDLTEHMNGGKASNNSTNAVSKTTTETELQCQYCLLLIYSMKSHLQTLTKLFYFERSFKTRDNVICSKSI